VNCNGEEASGFDLIMGSVPEIYLDLLNDNVKRSVRVVSAPGEARITRFWRASLKHNCSSNVLW
jgi:hypothetical protein